MSKRYWRCTSNQTKDGYTDPQLTIGAIYEAGEPYDAGGMLYIQVRMVHPVTLETLPGSPELERPVHFFDFFTESDLAKYLKDIQQEAIRKDEIIFPQLVKSSSTVNDLIRDMDKPAGFKEGRKNDEGKTRWDLMPWAPLSFVAEVMTYGARKYEENNWQKVAHPRARYTAAMVRHMVAWFNGQELDPESNLSHLAHAVCCALFLMHFEKKGFQP